MICCVINILISLLSNVQKQIGLVNVSTHSWCTRAHDDEQEKGHQQVRRPPERSRPVPLNVSLGSIKVHNKPRLIRWSANNFKGVTRLNGLKPLHILRNKLRWRSISAKMQPVECKPWNRWDYIKKFLCLLFERVNLKQTQNHRVHHVH